MIRKMLWLVAALALVCTAMSLVDRSRAARRRELWSEATD